MHGKYHKKNRNVSVFYIDLSCLYPLNKHKRLKVLLVRQIPKGVTPSKFLFFVYFVVKIPGPDPLPPKKLGAL